MIRKIMRIQGVGERFEKDGFDQDVIRHLAADPALSSGSFRSRESLQEIGERLSARLGGDGCEISFVGDEEQEENALGLRIFRPGRKNAMLLQPEIVKSAKFIELRSLLGQVTALGEPPFKLSLEGEESGNVELPSLDALVEHVMAAGKKGLSVQRYKGLGEMNPEQLWSTTMNPEKRTLLQVRVDDAVVADEIFTTLMGDQVEPRREFIYRNALYASNLDV
jgi:DNA gyrase subunit B